MIRRAALGAVWLAISASGMFALDRYKAQPGDAGDAPSSWPAESAVTRAANIPTLVLFAHPRCPCTRASLTELEKIASRLGEQVAIRVLFIQPAGVDASWEQTDLWTKARAIPRVEVLTDEGSGETSRFGSATSGQVLLYGADDRLLFRGGITSSRGHEGDNPGADRIVALVNRDGAPAGSAPVFGCPLFESAQELR